MLIDQRIKEYFENKNILITGGAGFIGSHLSEMLVNFNAKVTIVDDLSTGDLTNLESIINNITFIEGNLIDKEVCHKVTTRNHLPLCCAHKCSIINGQP